MTAPERAFEGYTLDEAAEGAMLSGRVAGDGSLVLRAYFKQQFAVEYLPGDHARAGSEAQLTGSLDYGAATPEGSFEPEAGYTFAGFAPQVADTVTSDATYTAQWTANADTAYAVRHYKQNVADDGYALADTDSFTGTTGAAVTAQPRSYEGFSLSEAAPGAVASGAIAGDGSLVLALYYDRQTFGVTYQLTGDVPEGAGEAPAAAAYRHGATVSVAGSPETPAGYTFSGWATSDVAAAAGSFEMPLADVAFAGTFTANSDISYKVEYYLQGPDGTYPADPA